MSHELKELLEDVKMTIEETVDDEWTVACQNYDYFKEAEEWEKAGDAYYSSGKYITEESENAFRTTFKRDYDVDTVIEKLRLSPTFRDALKQYIESYADTKQLWIQENT